MGCPKFFSKGTHAIYNAFSIGMVIIVYTFTISTLLYLFLSNPDLEDFTESLFYVLALITACVKIAIIFSKRNKIIQLADMLLDKKCSAQDRVEYYIQNKFDRISRYTYQQVYIYQGLQFKYTGWPRVGCRIGNLIGSSLVLKYNPTSTKDVQKALSQGRFL